MKRRNVKARHGSASYASGDGTHVVHVPLGIFYRDEIVFGIEIILAQFVYDPNQTICGRLAVRDDLISLSQFECSRILVVPHAHDETPRTFLLRRRGHMRF